MEQLMESKLNVIVNLFSSKLEKNYFRHSGHQASVHHPGDGKAGVGQWEDLHMIKLWERATILRSTSACVHVACWQRARGPREDPSPPSSPLAMPSV